MELSFSKITTEHFGPIMDLVSELKTEEAGVSFIRINTEEELEQWLEDPTVFVYGSFIDNKLVGIFKAKQGEKGKEHSCHIASALTKQCRGKGVGKKLLEYSLEQLQSEGIWMIRAYVYSDNTSSFTTLLSAGFQWSGTVHKHQWNEKLGRYIDDLIFHKELAH